MSVINLKKIRKNARLKASGTPTGKQPRFDGKPVKCTGGKTSYWGGKKCHSHLFTWVSTTRFVCDECGQGYIERAIPAGGVFTGGANGLIPTHGGGNGLMSTHGCGYMVLNLLKALKR